MRTRPDFKSTTNFTSTNLKEYRKSAANSSIQVALNRNHNYSPPSIREDMGTSDSSKNYPMDLNQATEIHSVNNKLETQTESFSKDFRIKKSSSLKIKIIYNYIINNYKHIPEEF